MKKILSIALALVMMLSCIAVFASCKAPEEKGVKVGKTAYIIGGGAKSKVWRQIVADALNLTLIQTENNDSSFGAAMCAGVAVGFFKDFDIFTASADAKSRCIERVAPRSREARYY